MSMSLNQKFLPTAPPAKGDPDQKLPVPIPLSISRKRRIGIFAGPGAGKTVWLCSLYFQRTNAQAKLTVSEKAREYLEPRARLLEAGDVPEGNKGEAIHLPFGLTTAETSWEIEVCDFPGEFAHPDGMKGRFRDEFWQWLLSCHAILPIIDVQNPNRVLLDVIDSLLIRLPASRVLGVVFAKWDEQRPNPRSPAEEQAYLYTEFLPSFGIYEQVVQALRLHSGRVEAFPVSAYGAPAKEGRPPKSGLRPFNILTPLVWAAERTDEALLNQAREQAKSALAVFPPVFKTALRAYEEVRQAGIERGPVAVRVEEEAAQVRQQALDDACTRVEHEQRRRFPNYSRALQACDEIAPLLKNDGPRLKQLEGRRSKLRWARGLRQFTLRASLVAVAFLGLLSLGFTLDQRAYQSASHAIAGASSKQDAEQALANYRDGWRTVGRFLNWSVPLQAELDQVLHDQGEREVAALQEFRKTHAEPKQAQLCADRSREWLDSYADALPDRMADVRLWRDTDEAAAKAYQSKQQADQADKAFIALEKLREKRPEDADARLRADQCGDWLKNHEEWAQVQARQVRSWAKLDEDADSRFKAADREAWKRTQAFCQTNAKRPKECADKIQNAYLEQKFVLYAQEAREKRDAFNLQHIEEVKAAEKAVADVVALDREGKVSEVIIAIQKYRSDGTIGHDDPAMNQILAKNLKERDQKDLDDLAMRGLAKDAEPTTIEDVLVKLDRVVKDPDFSKIPAAEELRKRVVQHQAVQAYDREKDNAEKVKTKKEYEDADDSIQKLELLRGWEHIKPLAKELRDHLSKRYDDRAWEGVVAYAKTNPTDYPEIITRAKRYGEIRLRVGNRTHDDEAQTLTTLTELVRKDRADYSECQDMVRDAGTDPDKLVRARDRCKEYLNSTNSRKKMTSQVRVFVDWMDNLEKPGQTYEVKLKAFFLPEKCVLDYWSEVTVKLAMNKTAISSKVFKKGEDFQFGKRFAPAEPISLGSLPFQWGDDTALKILLFQAGTFKDTKILYELPDPKFALRHCNGTVTVKHTKGDMTFELECKAAIPPRLTEAYPNE